MASLTIGIWCISVARAVGGAGLVIVEATAVTPDGRISPWDSGIYSNEHVETVCQDCPVHEIAGCGTRIQIAHAGRKASASRPWEGDHHLNEFDGGWETIAPSAIAFGEKLTKVPREMSVDDIAQIQTAFVDAAKAFTCSRL